VNKMSSRHKVFRRKRYYGTLPLVVIERTKYEEQRGTSNQQISTMYPEVRNLGRNRMEMAVPTAREP
jgi:hypothetical protein